MSQQRYDNEGPSSQWGQQIAEKTTRHDERLRALEDKRKQDEEQRKQDIEQKKVDKEEVKKWVLEQLWLTRNIAVGLASIVLVFVITQLLGKFFGH